MAASDQRLAVLPDVPSAKETGIDCQMNIWAGMFAPKGTPKEIVDKVAAALDTAFDDPSAAISAGRSPPRRNATPRPSTAW